MRRTVVRRTVVRQPIVRRTVVAALLVAAASGCTGGTDTVEIPEGAVDLRGQAEVVVAIEDNRFVPSVVVVSPGTTVVWRNDGRNEHDILPAEEGLFDPVTPVLTTAEQAARDFPIRGTYPYFCSIHGTPTRGQRGQILVIPDDGS